MLQSKNATLQDSLRRNKFMMCATVVQHRRERKRIMDMLNTETQTLQAREEELLVKRKAIEDLEDQLEKRVKLENEFRQQVEMNHQEKQNTIAQLVDEKHRLEALIEEQKRALEVRIFQIFKESNYMIRKALVKLLTRKEK